MSENVTSDMVLCLPLAERDGAVLASADAAGRPCAVSGAVRRAGGFFFDGVDDIIDCGHSPAYDVTGPLTVALWVRRESQVSNSYILANGTDVAWQLREDPSGSFQCSMFIGGAWRHVLTGLPVTDGVWHHLAAAYDGAAVRGFFDGCHVPGVDVPASGAVAVTAQSLCLGWCPARTPGNAFHGAIGGAWVYDRALTPLEIQDAFLATKGRYR